MRKLEPLILIGLIAGTASLAHWSSKHVQAPQSTAAASVNFPLPTIKDNQKPLVFSSKLSPATVAVNGVRIGMSRAEVVQLLGKPEMAVKFPNQPDVELCQWRNDNARCFVSFLKGAVRIVDGELLTIILEDGSTEIISRVSQLGPPNKKSGWEGLGVAISSQKHDPTSVAIARFRIFDPQSFRKGEIEDTW